MDAKETINQLQSSTVRASIVNIVISVLSIVTVFTGIAFDVEWIKDAINFGITALGSGASIYLSWKAITGRISATKEIEPLPWLEAAKNMKKEK